MEAQCKVEQPFKAGGMAPHKMRFLKKGEAFMSKRKKHKHNHRKTVSERLFEDAKPFYAKYTNDVTRKTFEKNYMRFIKYCRENFQCKTKAEMSAHIQDYADYLTYTKKYSASTIHLHLSGICLYHEDVPLSSIQKPIRHISDYKRGRQGARKIERNHNDLNNPKFAHLVDFQRVVGLRRAELKSLTGDCLIHDDIGYGILVKSGKGGKRHIQRIFIPEDIELIKKYFEGKRPNEKIFKPNEFNNDLNLHYLRAKNSQRYYDYYIEQLKDPKRREELIKALVYTYELPGKNGKRKRFNPNLIEGKYRYRGANLEKAKKLGLPTEYERLPALLTNVFNLAHNRISVGCQSYFLVK